MLTQSHSVIQYTLINVIRLMNYVEHKKHYSQVALSEKSVTITQIQCVHYYKFVRRSADGSPTLLSSMYGDNKLCPTLDVKEKKTMMLQIKQF